VPVRYGKNVLLVLSTDQPFPPISPQRSRCGLIHHLLMELESKESAARRSRCQQPAIETSKEAPGAETATEPSRRANGQPRTAVLAPSHDQRSSKRWWTKSHAGIKTWS